MIKNERQYRITRTRAERFARTLEGLRQRPEGADGIHPMIAQAQVDAVSSELADLETELREYEAVREGKFQMDELDVIPNLPALLIKGSYRPGVEPEGAGGSFRPQGAADTEIRGYGLRHGQMVPHQGGGRCAQYGNQWRNAG